MRLSNGGRLAFNGAGGAGFVAFTGFAGGYHVCRFLRAAFGVGFGLSGMSRCGLVWSWGRFLCYRWRFLFRVRLAIGTFFLPLVIFGGQRLLRRGRFTVPGSVGQRREG